MFDYEWALCAYLGQISFENQKGGIVEREASIHISNVMVVDKSGKATRVGIKEVDGKLKRYSKKSGEILDK